MNEQLFEFFSHIRVTAVVQRLLAEKKKERAFSEYSLVKPNDAFFARFNLTLTTILRTKWKSYSSSRSGQNPISLLPYDSRVI